MLSGFCIGCYFKEITTIVILVTLLMVKVIVLTVTEKLRNKFDIFSYLLFL